MYVQTDGAVTSAIYTCAEDYSLYGKAIRTCLSDNTWEFEIPACSKFILYSVFFSNMRHHEH